ncbi:hypothetical protein G7046_g7062 [Stylonectria norvegica]|nr:hypothetical protein G7046_g7062 [Stylonectria norvegica]
MISWPSPDGRRCPRFATALTIQIQRSPMSALLIESGDRSVASVALPSLAPPRLVLMVQLFVAPPGLSIEPQLVLSTGPIEPSEQPTCKRLPRLRVTTGERRVSVPQPKRPMKTTAPEGRQHLLRAAHTTTRTSHRPNSTALVVLFSLCCGRECSHAGLLQDGPFPDARTNRGWGIERGRWRERASLQPNNDDENVKKAMVAMENVESSDWTQLQPRVPNTAPVHPPRILC